MSPLRFWGRFANATPLPVSTVWMACTEALTMLRSRSALLILPALPRNSTQVNLDARWMARLLFSLPRARRSALVSTRTQPIARLGELAARMHALGSWAERPKVPAAVPMQ